ncbi:efflux RND transporter periplasmic adaptor subunit [Opitutus terrae]|uniref:Efflux transporter, RND family, MFP subunit n=1 Tax=Opitutus terrae (strain DSM 11246 / JCM 15787 / PB90-1) TaxID=452637 RepID=B1ZYI0_OPITP|nr:efflux RND transporter periplasmic adaptor subunit [Opitutus terrae]ACB77078.1 efflux transporter, RND family, MFP subunit [Opitutus terrae PB90-1]
MIKRFALTTVAIIVIVGALVGTKLLQFRAMAAAGAHMTPPPETVTSAPVREEDWPDTVTATGSVESVQGVTVAAELAGKVMKLAFEPGALVQAGDLLVQLDTSSEEAQLRAAEASAQLAKANFDRSRDLIQKATISQAELDAADAQYKEAVARADNIRATIAKKTIRAPFAGRLGLRLVNLGQILREGDAITTLQTLDPVYVNFSVPQQRLSVLHPGADVRVTTDAAPKVVFAGKITAISPEVDVVTRNVRVQATVPNVEERLRSGMFANVEVVLPTAEKKLIVPATAILYAPYGDSVFVIEEKKDPQSGQVQQVLRQQFVRLGGARGDYVAVTSGLKPGDQVVTSGVFKLRAGTPVVIDNKLAPDAKLDPKPANT